MTSGEVLASYMSYQPVLVKNTEFETKTTWDQILALLFISYV